MDLWMVFRLFLKFNEYDRYYEQEEGRVFFDVPAVFHSEQAAKEYAKKTAEELIFPENAWATTWHQLQQTSCDYYDGGDPEVLRNVLAKIGEDASAIEENSLDEAGALIELVHVYLHESHPKSTACREAMVEYLSPLYLSIEKTRAKDDELLEAKIALLKEELRQIQWAIVQLEEKKRFMEALYR